MSRFAILLVLLSSLGFISSAVAGDEPTPEAQSKKICDHLAKHAIDYEDKDKKSCEVDFLEVFTQIPKAKKTPLVECVISKKPITQSDFGECFGAAIGGDAAAGADTTTPTKPLPPELVAKIKTVCDHLQKNAKDFTEKDIAECPQGLATIAQMSGVERFESFSSCILAVPAPAEADFNACFKK